MSKEAKTAGPNRYTGWLPRHGARLAAALVVLLFIASGAVSYQSLHKVSEQDQKVEVVHGALIAIGTLTTDVNGTEADAFNYVITGAPSELVPYEQARGALDTQLAQLPGEVTTPGAQQRRIAELKHLIPDGITGLNNAVVLQEHGQYVKAQKLIAAGTGVDALASSRGVIAQMLRTEYAVLEQVTGEATAALRANTIVLLLVFVCDLILVGVVIALVRQSMLLREALAEERIQARTRNELEVLHETTRRMDEFIGIASHELRTPLAVLKANLQLIARRLRKYSSVKLPGCEGQKQESEELPDLQLPLERAVQATDRLDRLAGDLLDLSHLRAGDLEVRLSPCDLTAIVADCVRDMQAANPRRTITLELTDGPTPVQADRHRVRQALTNYLTNALKFSNEAAPVYVTVRRHEDHATVAVQDFGPGLPEEQRDLVWNRFHRVPGLSRRNGSNIGLGLGLYIAASIVERHGGTVGLDTELGKGSTFWFSIPLAPASGPPDGAKLD